MPRSSAVIALLTVVFFAFATALPCAGSACSPSCDDEVAPTQPTAMLVPLVSAMPEPDATSVLPAEDSRIGRYTGVGQPVSPAAAGLVSRLQV